LELQRAGSLPAEIVLVVASRPGIGALEHAKEHGVRSVVLPPAEIAAALDEERVDLVILAGYLKRWPIPDRYIGKTINIHPSLLPLFGGKGFYGDRVHEAVLRSGMRVTGCTVHFVTPEFDAGPIIAQRAVPVLPGDDAS